MILKHSWWRDNSIDIRQSISIGMVASIDINIIQRGDDVLYIIEAYWCIDEMT